MVSSALSLVMSLLCIAPTRTGAQSPSDVSVRMYPNDFHKMIPRESSIELSSIPVPERRKLWRMKTRQYYRAGSCTDKNQPCILPYIICDSTPNLSGHGRRAKLENKLSNQTPEKKQDLIAIDDLPFFNSEEKTCYNASMTPKTSQRIASKICDRDEKSCVVHPLIPMLKLSHGTVATVTKKTQDNTAPTNIMVELSPYYKQHKNDHLPGDITESIIAAGSVSDTCRFHLNEALPSTGANVRCQSLNDLQIQTEWVTDSIVSFSITPVGLESEGYREAVLQLISSLALRPELIKIEVSESQYFV